MTGDQLKHIRLSRKMSRNEFAEWLGNCSASGIVKWESGINPVPDWVAEKILSNVEISLPLVELGQLLQIATARNLEFHDLVRDALRSYINQDNASPTAPLLYEPIDTPTISKNAESA